MDVTERDGDGGRKMKLNGGDDDEDTVDAAMVNSVSVTVFSLTATYLYENWYCGRIIWFNS